MTVVRLARGCVLVMAAILMLAACGSAGTSPTSSSQDDVKYGRAPGSAY